MNETEMPGARTVHTDATEYYAGPYLGLAQLRANVARPGGHRTAPTGWTPNTAEIAEACYDL